MKKFAIFIIALPAFLLMVWYSPLIVSCHGDYHELDDNYVYICGTLCSFDDKELKTSNELIHFCVVDYNDNDDYIIACQTADSTNAMEDYHIAVPPGKYSYKDSLYEDSLNKAWGSPQVKDSLRNLYNKVMEIKMCYWIIVKKDGHVIGPMNRKDFDVACQRRGIKLKLDEEKIKQARNIYFWNTGEVLP